MTLAQRGGERNRRAGRRDSGPGVRQIDTIASLFVLPAMLLLSAAASAQLTELTAGDRAEIERLSSLYLQALGACDAEAYAGLFAPGSGYFASGFRGHFEGREQLIALVESERQCTAPAPPAARPGGTGAPTPELEVTAGGVRGIVRLGTAEYQDEYTKTPDGWRFASRTVVIATEAEAGLNAGDMLAINRLGGAELTEYYEADQGGTPRLMTVGTRISVVGGEVRGRVFLPAGGYRDEVYRKTAAGEWRVTAAPALSTPPR